MKHLELAKQHLKELEDRMNRRAAQCLPYDLPEDWSGLKQVVVLTNTHRQLIKAYDEILRYPKYILTRYLRTLPSLKELEFKCFLYTDQDFPGKGNVGISVISTNTGNKFTVVASANYHEKRAIPVADTDIDTTILPALRELQLDHQFGQYTPQTEENCLILHNVPALKGYQKVMLIVD